jgi:hypothetical protein
LIFGIAHLPERGITRECCAIARRRHPGLSVAKRRRSSGPAAGSLDGEW